MERIIRNIIIFFFFAIVAQPAASTAGQLFPDLRVGVTLPERHASYLGLAQDASSFRLSDVKARYLLINVFSLYCTPCQRDAPAFNEMYEKIEGMDLASKIKVIGLAAGNTVREMEFWRERFKVEFPLIPDEDYELHRQLGNVGTPFFVLARVDGPDRLEVLFSLEGAFEDETVFFDTIISHARSDLATSQ